MKNIKNKIKINKLKEDISDKWYKLLRFIFKPLMFLEDTIHKSKRENIEQKAMRMTDEQVINIISKDVVYNLIKNSGRKYNEECFNLKYNPDEDYTIVEYARYIKKDKAINQWGYNQNAFDNERILKLTEMLRLSLSEYEDIKCEYYQRNEYSEKFFIVKLK